jgi:hypothetical protein
MFMRLEQALVSAAELKLVEAVLSQAFSHIDRTTKEGLQKQISRFTGQSLWLVCIRGVC